MYLFLLIAFLLPFLCVAAESMVSNSLIQFILYGIEAASPTIAAITALGLNGQCKDFFVKMFHSKHLLTALVLPVTLAGSTMFLAKLIFCVSAGVDFTLGSISAVQFIIILWAFIAEEFGWRGYLEPYLKKKELPKWLVPSIVGVIWCLWHYHYFLLDKIQVPILLFCISCIIESYIYSFLMASTNDNLVSAMTYHFAWNLSIHIFAVNPADNNGSILPYLILAVIEALVLLILKKLQ